MSKKKIKLEENSGNMYVDLGLEETKELHARSQIGYHVYAILKQKDIAVLLGIKQRKASHLNECDLPPANCTSYK